MNISEILEKCELCPHKCSVNRIEGNVLGRCKAGKNPKIALARLHFFEEPCVSGKNGSGTVFFSGCNLSCKFCQNYEISQEYYGKEITIEELSNIFIDLQNQNANNINLVTGFMYVPQIIEAIKIARKNGLKIPIVYNSSGYESIETIKLLNDYIDVYLPDFKYYYNELGMRLSNVNNYPEIAKNAILEMYSQVGNPQIDENGIIQKGLIVRHLILPNHIQNSKMILKWIKKNLSKKVLVSVMAQYFPTNKANEIEDINRKLNKNEYEEILNFVEEYEINGYIQHLEENEKQYVPNFKEDNL